MVKRKTLHGSRQVRFLRVKLLKTAEADVNRAPSSPLYSIIHSKNGDISALMLFAVGWRTFRLAASGIG